MKEAAVPWPLHPPGAGWEQGACGGIGINESTKKQVGRLHCGRHMSELSPAAPSRDRREAACLTVSFTCSLVGFRSPRGRLRYPGWAVQGWPYCRAHTATPSTWSSAIRGCSENTTQRLLLKFRPCREKAMRADCIQHPGCMELRSLHCRYDRSERWTVSRPLLHKTRALSWQRLRRIWKCWNWIYSEFRHHPSERVNRQWNFKGEKLL